MNAASPKLAELKRIQKKLDAWELDHLRTLAAELDEKLQQANAQIEMLRNEVYGAEARADMFLALNNDLMESSGLRVGITQSGHMGVVQ